MSGGFEILEHTSDVGIRAWGESPEEAFEQAGWGLADVLGARRGGHGATHRIRARGTDPGGLLVDFLNELLLLHETEEVGFAAIRVDRLAGNELEGDAEIVPLTGELEGVGVKAATYHQLRVGRREDGVFEAQVYLDV